MKKLLSTLLALAMVMSLLPGTALAVENTPTQISGTWDVSTVTEGNFVLTGDTTPNGTLKVTGDMTIDLGTFALNQNSTRMIQIDGGSLTIKGTTGQLRGKGTLVAATGVIRVNANGTFTLEGGEITNFKTSKPGVVQAAAATATVNIKGGKIHNNQAQYGNVWSMGTLNISGGTICDNTATDAALGGGGVYVSAGTFNMTGGSVYGNSAASSGPNVYLANTASTVNLSGGTIGSTTDTNSVYIAGANPKVKISGSTEMLSGFDGTLTGISLGGLSEGAYIVSPEKLTQTDNYMTYVNGVYTYSATAVEPPTEPSEPEDPSAPTNTLSKTDFVDGETLTLTENSALAGAITLDAGSYTVDLNGYTLSGTAVPYFTVPAGGKLTVVDSSTAKTGKIDGSTVTTANATEVLISVSGTLEHQGGAITGYTMAASSKRGSAVRVNAGGEYNLYDGASVTNNKLTETSNSRGTIGVAGNGVFNMYGGTISGNTSAYGGAISNSGYDGLIRISGGTITNNTATGGNSAIRLSGCRLIITGGTISGNSNAATSTNEKTVIHLTGVNFTMRGGTISADKSGSTTNLGVFMQNSGSVARTSRCSLSGSSKLLLPLKIGGADIELGGLTDDAKILATAALPYGDDQTVAESQSGSNYVYTAKALTYDPAWTQLTAAAVADGTLDAGTYYLAGDVTLPGTVTVDDDVTLYLDGHTLTGSTAPLLTVAAGACLTINDRAGGYGRIQGITAAREMILVNGKLTLNNGTLTGHTNTAAGAADPGAVKVMGTGTFTMEDGTITENTTSGRGGAVWVFAGGQFTMNGGELTDNTAAYGGAIYVSGGYTAATDTTEEVYRYGYVTLTGGEIRYNTSTTSTGSAIYAGMGDITMCASSTSEGVVIEGDGSSYTVYGMGSKITMRAGAIDTEQTAATGAAFYAGSTSAGAKSYADFSGIAKLGGAGFKRSGTSTGSIHDLRRLGKVVSQIALTTDADDVSVGSVQDGSVYTYSYARPVDLRILCIGNSYGTDCFSLLSYAGDALDLNIEVGWLYEGSSTLRRHAYALEKSGFESGWANLAEHNANQENGAIYTYYRTSPETGKGMLRHEGDSTDTTYVNLAYALADNDWDIVTLQTGTSPAGFPGSFNSDVEFLVDYIKATEPNAQLYWNMTWSYDPDLDPSKSRYATFKEHFDLDARAMYNSIVDVVHENFAEGGKFHDDFAGWLPIGAAVQNMRESGYEHSMNRDGYHLSYKAGRSIAPLTILKTLFYDEVDLSTLKPEDLHFVELKAQTSIPDAYTVDEHWPLAMAAINAAAAEAHAGHHTKLTIAPAPTVEDATDGASTTVAQATLPIKPQFTAAETLKDGTVIVAAYENVESTPKLDPSAYLYSGYCYEGNGTIVIWSGNGTDWNYAEPLFVVDQAQLEAWGFTAVSGRYEARKADAGFNYTIFSDPRDPYLTAVPVDADNDGDRDDEMLLLTFWLRDYNKTDVVERGTFAVYSLDGGKSWQPAFTDSIRDGVFYSRGDSAILSDGSILMPYYTKTSAGALQLTWEPANKVWVKTADVAVTDSASQMALASPEGSTVYAFVGGSGEVLKSTDKGGSWQSVGDQNGDIAQPSLLVMDEDTLYAAWAGTAAPGDVYGKTVTLSKGWDNTDAPLLYDAAGTDEGKNEAGYPSAVMLGSGDVLVVSYDANYRSVVGTSIEMPKPELPEIDPSEPMDVEDFKNGDSITAPAVAGHVFGGWYTDAECTIPYTADSGKAYAKFVDEKVLSVKYQISAGVTQSSESCDLRLVSTVDDLNYREVGFKLSINDGPTVKVSTKTVFSAIAANDDGVIFTEQPSVFSEDSQYFITFTVTNIANEYFDTQIHVVPYWITMDGTEYDGIANNVSVTRYLENN
ncbi:MAG: DUF4886 domain-containing protein [Oscillospiraceae bacterium]|nr:DUF4886 domain-containing protein [Oscillospiraceae bacterium]